VVHTPNSPDDFWHHVNQSGGPDSCWPWLGQLDATGRGRYHFDNKTKDTHQIAYFIEYGIWLKRYDLSTCPALRTCCNPRHIERRTINHKALALDFTRMTKELDRQSSFSRYLSRKYPDLHWLIQLLGNNAGQFLKEHEGQTIKIEMTIPPRSQLIGEARAIDCFSTLNQAEPHDRMKVLARLQEQYECGQAAVEEFGMLGKQLLKDSVNRIKI
jgi:hypothetical protein